MREEGLTRPVYPSGATKLAPNICAICIGKLLPCRPFRCAFLPFTVRASDRTCLSPVHARFATRRRSAAFRRRRADAQFTFWPDIVDGIMAAAAIPDKEKCLTWAADRK